MNYVVSGQNFKCVECSKEFNTEQKVLLHHRMSHVLWKDPNFIKLRKSSVNKQWQNKDYKSKMLVILKDNSIKNWEKPEYRRQRAEISSKTMKKTWENPEFRKKMKNVLPLLFKNEDFREKLKNGMNKYSKENRHIIAERMSKTSTNNWKNPEFRDKISKLSSEKLKKLWKDDSFKNKVGKITSERTKQKWKNIEYRKMMVNLLKQKTSCNWKNPELRGKYKEYLLKAQEKFRNLLKNDDYRKNVISVKIKNNWKNPEYRNKITNSMKQRWKNPEYKNKTVTAMMKACNISPNKCEQSLQQILDELFPKEWKFVGDGSVILGGYSPDFINCNGKKLIIEFDGDYWHSSEKIKEKDKRKILKYKELGFDMLPIAEKDFRKDIDGVKNRIVDFVKNYEKEHSYLIA